VEATEEELNDIFQRAKMGKGITWEEQLAYHTALLLSVGKEYKKYD
jgi:glucuronate isomerase